MEKKKHEYKTVLGKTHGIYDCIDFQNYTVEKSEYDVNYIPKENLKKWLLKEDEAWQKGYGYIDLIKIYKMLGYEHCIDMVLKDRENWRKLKKGDLKNYV